jgi:predicted DNA repair protein MutK
MPSTLLTLLDDISTILDDVATMSKVALRKTAGVVGDDLALNAEQIAGVQVNRELPVVWSVAKGSALNKVILVPIALAISALLPMAVLPLLMIGGAYLCYEGCEKLLHKWAHNSAKTEEEHAEHVQALARPDVDVVALEKKKVQGAVRTDFILSAEIIVIALGTVSEAPFGKQLAVLALIAALMTVCVYGLVAIIIKLDDFGLYLSRTEGDGASQRSRRVCGQGILATAPWLMRGLSVAGTAAMFTVGGGILIHGVGPLHHAVELVAHGGGLRELAVPLFLNLLAGVVAGAFLVGIVQLVQKARPVAGQPS